jgi:hypothetical protein
MAVNKDLLQGIFRPVNDDIIQNPNQKIDIRFPFKRGNLITFNYTFWKTDPYPLVIISKEDKAIEKSAVLYKERLSSLFNFVSEPYILKNKSNSVMFHFFMASNNKTAVKIANEIIAKYNKQR